MSSASVFSRNSILSALNDDLGLQKVRDRFTFRTAEVDHTLQAQEKVMQAVHFPLSGLISSVIEMINGETAEVCCVGHRGMVNWESLLGQQESQFRHFFQMSGEVASIDIAD